MRVGHGFRWIAVVLIGIIGVTAVAPALPTLARQDDVYISFAMPAFMKELVGKDVIAQFEAQNPGVHVKIVPSDQGFMLYSSGDAEQDAKTAREYAATADVLYMGPGTTYTFGVLSGAYLNLAPLVRADSELNEDDFYPAAWQSAQWDGGIWFMPFAMDMAVLGYDPQAFDEAGLAYPTPDWTLEDFANAIRALTTFNPDGSVQKAAIEPLYGDYQQMLFHSVLGHGLYDPNTIPSSPLLTGADVEQALTTWQQLHDEKYMDGGSDESPAPMRITTMSSLFSPFMLLQSDGSDEVTTSDFGDTAPSMRATTLPGGSTGMFVEGVAVSSGTQHPEVAYALARFLSQNAQVAYSFSSARPARRSLAEAEPEVTPSDDEDAFTMNGPMITEEGEAVMDELLPTALPSSELRYMEYLNKVLRQMASGNSSAADVLQAVQLTALDDYQSLQAMAATPIQVSDAAPTVLAPGEIEVKFGVLSFMSELPNQEQWNQVLDEFAADDSSVGHVALETTFEYDLSKLAADYDCFYASVNLIPLGGLKSVLNLDPFLSADVNFDRNDLYPYVLQQVQRANLTWAYPLVLYPNFLQYNAEMFQQAGVPLPEGGWTMDEFVDALRMLKAANPDSTPFSSDDLRGIYPMLLAGYGALPLDYRSDPPVVHYDDPATVAALQQFASLVQDGYFAYSSFLGSDSFGGNMGNFDAPISTMGAFDWMFRDSGLLGGEEIMHPVTYPVSSQYLPVSYDIGEVFISANAQNPDACYSLIGRLAQHPELFPGMPTRRSQLESPAFVNAQSDAMLATFRRFDAMLNDPNAVFFPSSLLNLKGFVLQYFLDRAFDTYMKDGGDLAAELATAQQYTDEFQACVANIPTEGDSAEFDIDAYFEQVNECLTKVDPTAEFE